jgi:1-acyl-sn-glycerol-3-phosphate acyltransferase
MAPATAPLVRSGREIFAAPLPGLAPVHRRLALRALVAACSRLVTVEHPERLRGLPEPAIFAFNHSTAFEAVLAPAALIWLRGGRPIHFLADWMYLHLPLVGWLLRQSEPIPVYRKPARWRLGESHRLARRRASVMDACLERLAAGASLGIFPEGTRNRHPERLLRGRRGLGEIALRSAAPVVPVGLHFPAAARLGRAPRIGRLVLSPGEPMTFETERAAVAALPPGPERRAVVQRVVSLVMTEIARLSGKEESLS